MFIRLYISQNKHAPYLREIQESCNIKSHKTVIDRLTALERKGYIKRKLNEHRSIRLVNNKNGKTPGGLNLGKGYYK
jgi:SOS-response transcriptional repressor LexA